MSQTLQLKPPTISGVREIPPVRRPIFVSDIHLTGKKWRTVLAFLRFLKTTALQYDELFLVGDIFEYWIGDDAAAPAKPFVKAVKAYVDKGHRVYIMQGNRDVMLGEDFAASCGATLLATPAVIDVNGTRVLLSHGDEWCTLDEDYQQFRAMLRDLDFQKKALAMTVPERIEWAKNARSQSTAGKTEKTRAMMDVVDAAVESDCARYGCRYVIHGHTHRPATHKHGSIVRTVIPDWEIDGVVYPKKGWVTFNSQNEPVVVMA
ncbi:MAG: UDP-2,3-diacylglucosamine diphosphatase [Duodenibacillus sp.]|nr:UDP-2,3-diacylglucosamine diphosphatase [Duodenibacillus sp.]